MKRLLIMAVALLVMCGAMAQDGGGKGRDRKKNLVVKEWNTKAGSSTPYLDNVATYDELGRKIEEIEYASYGQKKRTTYRYEGASNKCVEQVEYDEKNHAVRIKQFEYNADGTRKVRRDLKPNGKLISTKTYEYSYK